MSTSINDLYNVLIRKDEVDQFDFKIDQLKDFNLIQVVSSLVNDKIFQMLTAQAGRAGW